MKRKRDSSVWQGHAKLADDSLISLRQWKERVRAGEELEGSSVFKVLGGCTVTEEDGFTKQHPDPEKRQILTMISRSSVDRDRDVIEVDGWNTQNYARNPVVIFGHDYAIPPIARGEVFREGDALLSLDTFASREDFPLADTIYRLAKGRFIHAKSVGFDPEEWTFDEDRGGFTFIQQELLESSWVVIPAHPEALVIARSKGVDLLPLKAWVEPLLDSFTEELGVVVPKAALEAVAKSVSYADGAKAFFDLEPAEIEEHLTRGKETKELEMDKDKKKKTAGTEEPETTDTETKDPLGSIFAKTLRGRELIRFCAFQLPMLEGEELKAAQETLAANFTEEQPAPWKSRPGRWAAFAAAAKEILEDEDLEQEEKELQVTDTAKAVGFGLTFEAVTPQKAEEEPETKEVEVSADDLKDFEDLDLEDAIKLFGGEDLEDGELPEELAKAIRDGVERSVDKQMEAATGRLSDTAGLEEPEDVN